MFERPGTVINTTETIPFLICMLNLIQKCLRGYDCLIHTDYQARSLLPLSVLLPPLDLRLGLFLCYEHSRHAWLGRCALTHSGSRGHAEIHCYSQLSCERCTAGAQGFVYITPEPLKVQHQTRLGSSHDEHMVKIRTYGISNPPKRHKVDIFGFWCIIKMLFTVCLSYICSLPLTY